MTPRPDRTPPLIEVRSVDELIDDDGRVQSFDVVIGRRLYRGEAIVHVDRERGWRRLIRTDRRPCLHLTGDLERRMDVDIDLLQLVAPAIVGAAR
jgi:hypothetical protein